MPDAAVARNVAPQHRVSTTYLVRTADGMLAQNTKTNRDAFGAGAFTVLDNGDALPAIAEALGCKMRVLRARSLTDPNEFGTWRSSDERDWRKGWDKNSHPEKYRAIARIKTHLPNLHKKMLSGRL